MNAGQYAFCYFETSGSSRYLSCADLSHIITGCRWPMHLHIEALCWFSTVRSIASWPSLLESIVAHSRWMYAAELHGTAGSCLSLAAGLHTGTVVIRCMQSAKAETVAQVCMVAAHASHRDLSSTRFPREPTDNSAQVRSRRLPSRLPNRVLSTGRC